VSRLLNDGAADRTRVVVAALLLGLCCSSCTNTNGEVGVYVASAGRPDASRGIRIPLPDARSFRDSESTTGCVPGRYDGTFTCNFGFAQSCDQNTGNGPLMFTGPVSLTFVTVPTGTFLAVSGGTLSGSSSGFTLSGPLSGSLDCLARTFTGSFDGTYSSSALPALPGVSGQLSGPIESGFDPQTPALVNGHWCLTATTPGTSRTDPCADIPTGSPGSCFAGSCAGTWSAIYVPGT